MNATNASNVRIRLIGTPIGSEVRLADLDEALEPLQREQLLAYGLTQGHTMRVLQQKPMTIVLFDHVEVALEHAIAKHLWVERIAADTDN